jgi:predicted SAM-dependent methyltransferase
MSIRRLHWGCGSITPEGWINSDVEAAPGVDLCCNILDGLLLEDDTIDYISIQHALQDLKIYDQVKALTELLRVLKPGGVLRVSLPDLDRAIDAYRSGRHEYFLVYNPWKTISGNFITQMLWYNKTQTLFTYEFAEELMYKAGFRQVQRVAYRVTASPYPEIIELDSRQGESFYAEALK